jgi:hypothetical protein
MCRVAVSFVLLASLVALSGCGESSGVATYPVTGTVMVDGKPAGGARVIFCPKQGSAEEITRLRPVGITDANGQFGLMTFVKGDGAPAGEYNVIVRWSGDASQNSEGARDRGSRPKDQLKGKYGNPEQSGLSATVAEGETTVPPFQLTAR